MSTGSHYNDRRMDTCWNILIVDDDPDTLRICARYLGDAGYRVSTAMSGQAALALFDKEVFHLVLTDMMMPGLDGLGLMREVRKRSQRTALIMMTAYASIHTAVEAMRSGAADYIPKPINPEELRIKIAKALEQHSLKEEIEALKRKAVRGGGSGEIIGGSAAMRKALNLIALVAARDVPVMLTGESGSGKEVAARAIHNASPRAQGPFIVINCAAVPETLLESELFGYVRGAFTGAFSPKKGLFEEASGGTLLLDEITDAPLSIQSKLLRVLQEGEIRRLGSTKDTRVNVRVLAASNRGLRQAIASGQFREDLFYRLCVVTIALPSLRERPEDILPLADHFIRTHGPSINASIRGLSQEARAKLAAYAWPGNVRELENCIKQALVVAAGAMLTLDDITLADLPLQPEALEAETQAMVLAEAEKRFLRAYFEKVLNKAGGNVTEAAKISGISRKNVYEQMRRAGLKPNSFRSGT